MAVEPKLAEIESLLSGETVPDVHTVAVLEDALGIPLWPDYASRQAARPDVEDAPTR